MKIALKERYPFKPNDDLIDMVELLHEDPNQRLNDPRIQYCFGFLTGVADTLDVTVAELLDQTEGVEP